jgi:hypothetical protein
MGDLGMDDNEPSLTAVEKRRRSDLAPGTLGHLPSALYRLGMSGAPAAGQSRAGTFWYYNNWD